MRLGVNTNFQLNWILVVHSHSQWSCWCWGGQVDQQKPILGDTRCWAPVRILNSVGLGGQDWRLVHSVEMLDSNKHPFNSALSGNEFWTPSILCEIWFFALNISGIGRSRIKTHRSSFKVKLKWVVLLVKNENAELSASIHDIMRTMGPYFHHHISLISKHLIFGFGVFWLFTFCLDPPVNRPYGSRCACAIVSHSATAAPMTETWCVQWCVSHSYTYGDPAQCVSQQQSGRPGDLVSQPYNTQRPGVSASILVYYPRSRSRTRPKTPWWDKNVSVQCHHTHWKKTLPHPQP